MTLKIHSTPKFNLNRMDGTIVLTMNSAMAACVLELLDDFSDSDLNPYEYAMVKQLERMVDRTNDKQPVQPKV